MRQSKERAKKLMFNENLSNSDEFKRTLVNLTIEERKALFDKFDKGKNTLQEMKYSVHATTIERSEQQFIPKPQRHHHVRNFLCRDVL